MSFNYVILYYLSISWLFLCVLNYLYFTGFLCLIHQFYGFQGLIAISLLLSLSKYQQYLLDNAGDC